jgi:hypothetical protein
VRKLRSPHEKDISLQTTLPYSDFLQKRAHRSEIYVDDKQEKRKSNENVRSGEIDFFKLCQTDHRKSTACINQSKSESGLSPEYAEQ